jgi:hypothetical protein
MRFADQRAKFNRRFVNRLMRPLSGRVAMWSIIEHRGRRSGDVTDPRIVPTQEAAALLSAPWRQVIGRLGTPTALLLRRG